eukprot:jgi/Mesen1/5240/ME000026S04535
MSLQIKFILYLLFLAIWINLGVSASLTEIGSYLNQFPAADPLDPHGNVTIYYDVVEWSKGGYTAAVRIQNYQAHRSIEKPGWKLGWTWKHKEYIQSIIGAETILQGDCSNIAYNTGITPHCCEEKPTIIDLRANYSRPPDQQVANCCRGGVLQTVKQNANFSSSMFQAFKSWKVVCRYNPVISLPAPTCCVSLSTFYNETIVPCKACSCACGNFTKRDITCDPGRPESPYLSPVDKSTVKAAAIPAARECSTDGCPISIHWHLAGNYVHYWKVKITIVNRNLFKNLTDWTLAIQHPNLNNISEVYNWNVTSLRSSKEGNDTALLYGEKNYNDMILQAGEFGYQSSEILLGKARNFTLSNGWPFPQMVMFNGDMCVMPGHFPTLPAKLPHIFALVAQKATTAASAISSLMKETK